MLNARCRRFACRKPAVTIRHHSPSATGVPASAPWTYTSPPPRPIGLAPVASIARNAMTLIAISAYVSCGSVRSVATVRTFVFWREHSGQRMPTGVGVMQSGQIGRPQDEHDTPVSRSGWR